MVALHPIRSDCSIFYRRPFTVLSETYFLSENLAAVVCGLFSGDRSGGHCNIRPDTGAPGQFALHRSYILHDIRLYFYPASIFHGDYFRAKVTVFF